MIFDWRFIEAKKKSCFFLRPKIDAEVNFFPKPN